MSNVVLRNIVDADFRANPVYQLVLFDRLPPGQQDALKDLTKDPDFYGVLIPQGGSARNPKSVSQDTALLFLTLSEPGSLPAYVRAKLGDTCNQTVAELVLDGVLSPRWKRRFPGKDAVAAYLGTESGGAGRRFLDQRWSRMKLAPEFDGWCEWESRAHQRLETGPRQGYKLYVSPQPEFVQEAFHSVLELLRESPAHHFKVGSDAAGLLRPDKIVIYFWDFESLQETAKQIAARLAGCPAQGVPFSAGLGGDALLSWGIDPQPEKGALAWQERESWRLWLTNRLAVALLAAKKAPTSGLEPWRFALERLRLDNVDTETWAPLASFGQPAGAEA